MTAVTFFFLPFWIKEYLSSNLNPVQWFFCDIFFKLINLLQSSRSKKSCHSLNSATLYVVESLSTSLVSSFFVNIYIFSPLFLISHNIQCYLVIFLHHYRGFESWDECLVTFAKASDIWILFSSICLETRRNPPNSPQSWLQECRNRVGGGGDATGTPNFFFIAVNPIPAGRGQTMPINYYWHTQMFSPSGISVAITL